ncbi:MAG: hypothetical protein ACK541_01945 [Burkholderiales bacterium]
MKAWRIKLSEEAIRQRLEMLERWKASGLPKKAWAQAQGVDMAVLVSASGYEARWLLDPGAGKTHQAYAWVYRTSDLCTSGPRCAPT